MAKSYLSWVSRNAGNLFAMTRRHNIWSAIWEGNRTSTWIFQGMESGWPTLVSLKANCGEARWMAMNGDNSVFHQCAPRYRVGPQMENRLLSWLQHRANPGRSGWFPPRVETLNN